MNALDAILDLFVRSALRRAFDLVPDFVRASFRIEHVFEGARLTYEPSMRHRYLEEADRVEQMIDALRVSDVRAELDETGHRIVVSRIDPRDLWSAKIWADRIRSALRRKFRSSYTRQDFDRAEIKVFVDAEANAVAIDAALPTLADLAAGFACEHVRRRVGGFAEQQGPASYKGPKMYRAVVKVRAPVAKTETDEAPASGTRRAAA